MVRPALLVACLALLPSVATAERSETPELPVRMERLHISYVLDADGRRVATREMALKVLREEAVEHAKRSYVAHSTSVERAEVIEAYTRKPDGTRSVSATMDRGGEDGTWSALVTRGLGTVGRGRSRYGSAQIRRGRL